MTMSSLYIQRKTTLNLRHLQISLLFCGLPVQHVEAVSVRSLLFAMRILQDSTIFSHVLKILVMYAMLLTALDVKIAGRVKLFR